MPLPLTLTLIGVVVVAVVLRFSVPGLPLRHWARPLTGPNGALAALGALGLVGHCTAMFYPRLVGAIPGSSLYLDAVNAMSTTSVVLYVVSALLVLTGLRHQLAPWLVVLVLALVAVGITMYDGGPLPVHLAAITAAVVLLALTAALLAGPERSRHR